VRLTWAVPLSKALALPLTSHSPCSPSHLPFILNFSTAYSANEQSKTSGVLTFPSFTPFQLSATFLFTFVRPTIDFRLPSDKAQKGPFQPSRATSFPPVECDSPRIVVLPLPPLWLSCDLLGMIARHKGLRIVFEALWIALCGETKLESEKGARCRG